MDISCTGHFLHTFIQYELLFKPSFIVTNECAKKPVQGLEQPFGYMFCNKHLQNFTGSPPFLYQLTTPTIYSCVNRSYDPVIAYLISRDEVDYRLSKVSTSSICI